MKPSNLVDWRNIEGWLYNDEADWLYEQVKALPDNAIIVEIGAWMGRSTCALALGCTGTGKRVFTIDTFKGSREHQSVPPKLREKLELNLERLGVSRYVYIIQDESLSAAKEWVGGIDLFFLDGNHDDTAADIRAWRDYVRGLFAVHDAAGDGAWENVKQAVDEEFAGLERGECCSIAYFDLGGKDERTD
jgi:predicted O-methyltransferase YrrM